MRNRTRTSPRGQALIAAAREAGASDIGARRLLRELLDIGRASRVRGLPNASVLEEARAAVAKAKLLAGRGMGSSS